MYLFGQVGLNLNYLQNQMTAKMTHKYLYYNDLFISLENPEVKSQPTGVSTFAIRTSQSTGQKLQKNLGINWCQKKMNQM
jgi:hypothetical protein